MSPLQLGLIVAGVVLVLGVLVFNWWQLRSARRRLEARAAPRGAEDAPARREPSLRRDDESGPRDEEPDVEEAAPASAATVAGAAAEVADTGFRPPMAPLPPLPGDDVPFDDGPSDEVPAVAAARPSPRVGAGAESSTAAAPDHDIETIAVLQPVQPVGAGALAAGLHARLGKAVRWYGRREGSGPWQRLSTDSRGDYAEIAACMLLADRNGPASRSQIEAFLRLAGEIARTLPGAVVAPDAADEAERAEALDRLCAELDIQIGMTILPSPPGSIAGTRLRGVAEAAGFRLAPSGRFEWVQEETGAVLFTLQNVSDEPFTLDGLRTSSASGVVFVLDVPRVADPARAFDQMKLAARRMAHTLDGDVVDDNRRALNDAGFAAIRQQVVDAAAALGRANIEPGSPRALKLFAA